MSVKRMDLAWITVANLEQSKKFFTEVLGLKVGSYSPEYGWLELVGQDGGAYLGVAKEQPEHSPDKPGANAVVAMNVDDIEVMKKVLESKNVNIVGEIQEVPGHVKLLTFTDADGNKFQLAQQLSK